MMSTVWLLVSIAWSTTVGEPWLTSDVQVLADSVKAYYAENSYGRVVLQPVVTPWIHTAVAPDSGDCNSGFYIADAAAPTLNAWGYAGNVAWGFLPGQTPYKASFITPIAPGCWAHGLTYSEYLTWINFQPGPSDVWYTAHELGHTYGLSHSAAITSGVTRAGNLVLFPPLNTPAALTIDPTGDPSSAMSYQHYNVHFNAPEKTQLGWITPAPYSGGEQSYQLTPLAQPGGSIYAVTVDAAQFGDTGGRKYWFEYRKPISWDVSPLMPEAVYVHVTGDYSNLHDAAWHACYTACYVAALGVGETFTDGNFTAAVTAPGTVLLRQAVSAMDPVARLQGDVLALVAGQLPTRAQIDQLLADIAMLAPTIMVPPAASATDAAGAVWTLGAATQYGQQILRNDISAAGGQGNLIVFKNGQIKVQNNAGNWYVWGGGSWTVSTAP